MATAIATQPELKAKPLPAKVGEYVDGVLSGEIVTGKLARLAVERHVIDLQTAEERGLDFIAYEAADSIEFIECLRHSKGKWQGELLILEPWEAFITASLFGWKQYDAETAQWFRRFNTGFISTARKTGKSTLLAAYGHKLFGHDGEPGADVYTAATKRDQARIVHGEAIRMVRKSPGLSRLVKISRDNLFMPSSESKYEPLGADMGTDDGLNVHGALVDEVHAHSTRGLWDVLESATGMRDNPMLLGITTAGEAGDQESIYWELKNHSIKVLQGIIEDDNWFAYIATLDEGDDWTNERVWPKANPDIPHRPTKLRDIRKKVNKAKTTPGAVPNLRRKTFNVDVESLEPWIPDEQWVLCNGGDFYDDNGLKPEVIERFRGRSCCVGGDLSSLKDLTTLQFAFYDGTVDVISFCWCPRKNAEGRTRDKRVPYMQWAERGRLTLTEGNSVDYDALRHLLRTARDDWKWDIGHISFDPSNARYLVTKLIESDGFNGENNGEDQVIEQLQTTNGMNEPINVTEKAVLDGDLRHGGHEVLRWCVSNVKVFTDTGGRRRFDKKKTTEKIDLAVGTVMAVYRAVMQPVTSFIYDNEDIKEL